MSEPRHLSATDDGYAAHSRAASGPTPAPAGSALGADSALRGTADLRAETARAAGSAQTIAPPPFGDVGAPAGPLPSAAHGAPAGPPVSASAPSATRSSRRESKRQARRAARSRLAAATSAGQPALAVGGSGVGVAAYEVAAPAGPAAPAEAPVRPRVAEDGTDAYSAVDERASMTDTNTTSVSYRGDPGWSTQGGHLSGGVPVGARPQISTRPAPRPRGPRQARLRLRRIDPWSVLKFSFVLGLVLFAVWMVVIGILYGVLNGSGVFNKINSTVNEINGGSGRVVTPQLVLGAAAVVGAVEVVLFTAVATVGSFIYNLCADVVGGVEVTFGERD